MQFQVVICAVLAMIAADPDPKKYKSEVKTKDKQSEKSVLTEEERKFLREVEVKFGIKPELNVENSEEGKHESDEDTSDNDNLKTPKLPLVKPPFPAVIAIEIVNDTDSKLKGKRTIDANLGYGYRTSNGYTYSYFGKPAQEKGKFMIYPYSQEDIPPANPNSYAGYSHQSHGHKTIQLSPNVEITPSQAYELVPAKGEEETSYNYEKPAVQLKTKYEEDVQTSSKAYPVAKTDAQTPPSSTLYTTYNGKEFSGLSEQFPQVMSNYLVHPSQLVNNPQYQNAGLTQEHLRSHGANVGQRVVPVLVLRIPSSYIKNPTAELYANLPQNYPLSQYLNHLNLQQLVNEYFKKIGYSYAPQVMTYPHSSLAVPERHVPTPVSQYTPQQYASPYVQPSYTHADYSGVQYSAVQPVMARYPAGYVRQQYYVPRGNSIYQQPHQKYLYMYRYIPPTAVKQQSYYVQQPQYQQPESYQTVQAQAPRQKIVQEIIIHENAAQSAYGAQQAKASDDDSQENLVHNEQPHSQNTQQYEQSPADSSEYEDEPSAMTEYGHSTPSPTSEYGPTQESIPQYHSQSVQIQYDQNPVQKEIISIYHRSQAGHNYNVPNYLQSTPESYTYQNQIAGNEHSSADDLVLTENYPSKDHTIATVFPASHKSQTPSEPIQAVSYVTPSPTMKYHSRYRVMVPQTILKTPSGENVAYVNSHSVSQSSYGQSSSKDYNPEDEYTSGSHYVSPVGKQRQPSYPRNYHAHPKRMSRSENKSDTSSSTSKKHEKNTNNTST